MLIDSSFDIQIFITYQNTLLCWEDLQSVAQHDKFPAAVDRLHALYN
jgi:hypothetical protein